MAEQDRESHTPSATDSGGLESAAMQSKPPSELPDLQMGINHPDQNPPTAVEQLAEFDRAYVGRPKTTYASRNRQILLMRSMEASLDKIVDVTGVPKATVRWVLKIARRRMYARLVEKHPAGRKGKRVAILEALRAGASAREVERQFQVHRTTVLRARRQLGGEAKIAIGQPEAVVPMRPRWSVPFVQAGRWLTALARRF